MRRKILDWWEKVEVGGSGLGLDDKGGELEQNVKFKNEQAWDFPGGAVVKNLPANAGNTDSIRDPGRSHMLRNN